MTFYIGHHYNKFKDFNLLEMKEIPLILLPDFQENKIDDKTLKEYFFPSRIYLLDTYLQIKPDQEIFQKLDRLFEEWKLESSLKIDFSKLNMEMKGIESKLNQYLEDFFIYQIRRFPKLYRNSSEEIRSNKRILLSSPMEFVNASNKLKNLKNDPNLMELCLIRNPKNIVFFSQNNEFFIHGIVDHLHAYMIDYLEILEGPFNQDSFHQWYFNQFPRIWFYLKERILLKKFPQKFNSVHYLNKELEKLNFSTKIWFGETLKWS
jgi:hypothetical protein